MLWTECKVERPRVFLSSTDVSRCYRIRVPRYNTENVISTLCRPKVPTHFGGNLSLLVQYRWLLTFDKNIQVTLPTAEYRARVLSKCPGWVLYGLSTPHTDKYRHGNQNAMSVCSMEPNFKKIFWQISFKNFNNIKNRVWNFIKNYNYNEKSIANKWKTFFKVKVLCWYFMGYKFQYDVKKPDLRRT